MGQSVVGTCQSDTSRLLHSAHLSARKSSIRHTMLICCMQYRYPRGHISCLRTFSQLPGPPPRVQHVPAPRMPHRHLRGGPSQSERDHGHDAHGHADTPYQRPPHAHTHAHAPAGAAKTFVVADGGLPQPDATPLLGFIVLIGGHIFTGITYGALCRWFMAYLWQNDSAMIPFRG